MSDIWVVVTRVGPIQHAYGPYDSYEFAFRQRLRFEREAHRNGTAMIVHVHKLLKA